MFHKQVLVYICLLKGIDVSHYERKQIIFQLVGAATLPAYTIQRLEEAAGKAAI